MTDRTSIELACTLYGEALRARSAELARELWPRVLGSRELPDGYALRFPREPGMIERLADFVAFESRCCAFVEYRLVVGANGGPLELAFTGPEGTKAVLREALPLEQDARG